MTLDLFDILAPPVVAVVVSLLGWGATRAINGGRSLNPIQQIMFFFSFWFVLGMGYSMMLVGALDWPHWAWIPPTVVWALLLGYLAWRRRRRQRESESA
jgi:lipopolysaccharide export LptBFGC system permease protein LptF